MYVHKLTSVTVSSNHHLTSTLGKCKRDNFYNYHCKNTKSAEFDKKHISSSLTTGPSMMRLKRSLVFHLVLSTKYKISWAKNVHILFTACVKAAWSSAGAKTPNSVTMPPVIRSWGVTSKAGFQTPMPGERKNTLVVQQSYIWNHPALHEPN